MKHICYEELTELEKGTHANQIKILVIGTFNPKTLENKINTAKWFYGREINEFWFLFPKMLGLPSIHPADIEVGEDHHLICKQFCIKNNILIVDMIKEINAELKGFTDSEINTIDIDNVIPFDYSTAFKFNKPELVVFSWKSSNGKIIGNFKKNIIKYLKENSIKFIEVPSGSPIYRKGRKEKLNEWKQEFSK